MWLVMELHVFLVHEYLSLEFLITLEKSLLVKKWVIISLRLLNIIEISQTLMSGAFTMMMVVETQNSDFSAFQAELSRKGEALGVNIHVQNEAIFNAMHKL